MGTDALSPPFAQLLPIAFPNAELVDGELAMRAARRIKTEEEIGRCGSRSRRRSRPGRRGGRIAPGVTEQILTGVLLEAMTAGGFSTPANQDAVW